LHPASCLLHPDSDDQRISHSALRIPHPASRIGQALLELAVFGSFIIMLIGAMLRYGLDADYNQRVTMDAFRGALRSAETNAAGTVSVSIVRDHYIPDPTHPYALGNPVTVSASAAGVVKDRFMDATPDAGNLDDLPRTHYEINDYVRDYTSAGFLPGTNEFDYCAGEIVDYEMCKAQCRDSAPANQSPYCDSVEAWFSGLEDKAMGLQLQPVTTRTSTVGVSQLRQETPQEVSTTRSVDQRDTLLPRTFVRRDLGSGQVVTDALNETLKDEQTSKTWITPQ
jgi:hypothetical protein